MTDKAMPWKLWSVSLATFLLAQTVATQTTLFSPDEPITQLTLSNFTSVISNSPKIWLVDFYAAWCGHCQKMAPEFSAVARNIQDWSDVVGMAAVACSDPANSALCRSYGITGYPMIRFFPPNSESSFHGHRYEGDKFAEGLRIGILEYLSEIISQGRSDRSWPRLDSIGDLQDLWRSNRVREVFVVVEDETMSAKYIGLMVILDSLQMRPDVVVGRMSSQEAERYGVLSPGLYRATSFNVLHKMNREVSREPIARAIREAAGRGTSGMEQNTIVMASVAPKPSWTSDQDYTPPKGLHMQDLESSLYYSLWVEIPSHVSFDNESLAALKKYIQILTKYHPGEAHIKRFLSQLNLWLSSQHHPLSAQSWLQKLQSIQSEDAYIPESLRWTGCNGSQPHLRGYPCSLWMTFHAITVSAYVKEIANMSFDPHNVLIPIRDYVHHFLSCRECATNFGHHARHLETTQLETRDVVLWLWKVHNSVNSRLHGDATEDPLHPKLQFPSYNACPSCHVTTSVGLRFNPWREDRVLTYLLRYYGKEFIFNDDVEGMSRPHGGSSSTEDHVTGSPAASCPPLSSSDWTPCSRTCNVGLSVRMIQSQASGCRLQQEVRLCLVRPCATQFPNWTQSSWHETHCPRYGHTYRLAKPFTMSYGNCSLTTAEAWRVCGLCPSNRNPPVCCHPQRSSTQIREAACLVRSGVSVRRVLGSVAVEVIDFCRCDRCAL